MKHTIVFAGLLIGIATPLVQADEVSISPTSATTFRQTVNGAFSSCVNAFVAEIFPGHKVRFATKLQTIDRRTEQLMSTSLDFGLRAISKLDKSVLAEASCTARGDMRVHSLSVRTPDPNKLAGLKPSDVQLVMASR